MRRTSVRRHIRKTSRGPTAVVRHNRTVPTAHGKREFPPEPSYNLCNQGHRLSLFEDERGRLTWDCPICIRSMEKEREKKKNKSLGNSCVVCGEPQIGLHYHEDERELESED